MVFLNFCDLPGGNIKPGVIFTYTERLEITKFQLAKIGRSSLHHKNHHQKHQSNQGRHHHIIISTIAIFVSPSLALIVIIIGMITPCGSHVKITLVYHWKRTVKCFARAFLYLTLGVQVSKWGNLRAEGAENCFQISDGRTTSNVFL